MSIIKRFTDWFDNLIIEHERKTRKAEILRKCGCICYCPSCKEPLNDQAECEDTDLVRYTCQCGHKSEWNFDLWACPALRRGNEWV